MSLLLISLLLRFGIFRGRCDPAPLKGHEAASPSPSQHEQTPLEQQHVGLGLGGEVWRQNMAPRFLLGDGHPIKGPLPPERGGARGCCPSATPPPAVFDALGAMLSLVKARLPAAEEVLCVFRPPCNLKD